MNEPKHKQPKTQDPNRRQAFVQLGVGSLCVAGAGATVFGYEFLSPNVLNRPKSAHSTAMSPRSGPCSSAPFCTSGLRASRAFWTGLPATYKVLTTLTLVECP